MNNKNVLSYQPRSSYPFDIEVFSFSNLRSRTTKDRLDRFHKYLFNTIVFVTSGNCVQWIGNNELVCKPGTLLLIKEGQIHKFGWSKSWDGWIILFKGDLVSNKSMFNIEDDKSCSFVNRNFIANLDSLTFDQTLNVINQMVYDSNSNDYFQVGGSLLKYQLTSLLIRVFSRKSQPQEFKIVTCRKTRMERFEALVQRNSHRWHKVSNYTNLLGCSEKSLSRTTLNCLGVTAKKYIEVSNYEKAKIILKTSKMQIKEISYSLGFSETTNFCKFFKRHSGMTPENYRKRYIDTLKSPEKIGIKII